VRGFFARATAASVVQACVTVALAPHWERVLAEHLPPWHASVRAWPLWVSALLGYVAITFVFYFWHRARHEVPVLWRSVHQVHHAPARIEVITSFYKHPLEIVLNGVLSSAILIAVAGVDTRAASVAVLLTGLAELFYHWNVRTPHWLGYVIQRPESHRLHHARGRHRNNYSDLPLWDMLFGTFENPRQRIIDCGLGDEAEQQLGAMLCGRDVLVRGGR
jgi:sterol desaturase/sphingolipid hydroxylase (fatty acid hydroxylase superfamily)